jgi:hypothetical protein
MERRIVRWFRPLNKGTVSTSDTFNFENGLVNCSGIPCIFNDRAFKRRYMGDLFEKMINGKRRIRRIDLDVIMLAYRTMFRAVGIGGVPVAPVIVGERTVNSSTLPLISL